MINRKLVRDGIPNKIRNNGEPCVLDTHYIKAQPEEMVGLLEAKLREEVEEFFAARRIKPQIPEAAIDELADLVTVCRSLAHWLVPSGGLSRLELVHDKKLEVLGGFDQRFVLFIERSSNPNPEDDGA